MFKKLLIRVMKKIVCLFWLISNYFIGISQNGLENVIVEKYYVSTTNDTLSNSSSGILPLGSVTYRIFLDLLPGYSFQAAYGSPNHELKISTSTFFFNNIENGDVIPNVIPRRSLKKNTVMLDSWLSAGAAGEQYYGAVKDFDNTIETIQHEKGFLQNKNEQLNFSLAERDGLIDAENVPRPTFFGIDSLANIFKFQKKESIFSTTNGAWACMGKGSYGPDSLTSNRVLIAQMTTDGMFEFELNIQIGTPTKGISQNYVARNPVGNEIVLPSLIFKSEGMSKRKKRVKRQ